MQLFVAGAAGTERELLDPVTAERRMRVAVDEPRQRAEAAPVELVRLAVEARQVAHPPDGADAVAVAEHVRVVDHLHCAEGAAAHGRTVARGRDELAEIADEQARPVAVRHARQLSPIGVLRPCSRAACAASG